MTTQQLMDRGHKEIHETNAALDRSEKLVEDTMEIGATTASTLHDQTGQMNKIVDDLNEMEFTMKKASRVIRDISRGLLTDKCISFLLLLVIFGVIAIVIVKVINPNKDSINGNEPAAADQNATDQSSLARNLPRKLQAVLFHQLYDPLEPHDVV